MDTPPGLELLEGYARHRPTGEVRFRPAVEGAGRIVAWCREHGIEKLLLDSSGLTGFANPGPEERFLFGEALARAAQGQVKIAIVTRPEIMDAEKFGITVARNRGLFAEGFTSEAEAVAWLLDPDAK